MNDWFKKPRPNYGYLASEEAYAKITGSGDSAKYFLKQGGQEKETPRENTLLDEIIRFGDESTEQEYEKAGQ